MIKLDGKKVSEEIIEGIKKNIPFRRSNTNTLVIITVGEDEASKVYVGRKKKKAEECGYIPMHIQLGEETNIFALESLVKDLNKLEFVKGIIIQKPLTAKLEIFEKEIDSLIDPIKDVDGFHPVSYHQSCTPKGIITLLDAYKVPYRGKRVVIAGRSKIVAKPLAEMLMNKNCTVTMIHSVTDEEYVKSLIRDCDVFISAIGKPHYWTKDYFENGRKKIALVDVGINRLENKLVGDIHTDCYEYSEYYTPVPGGVGAMTVATLMRNMEDVLL